MIDKTKIKAIFIDVDDTLLDFRKCSEFSMKEAARLTGTVLPDGAFDVFWRINNELWFTLQAGKIDLAELRRIRWNTIFDALGVKGDGVVFEGHFERALGESTEKIEGAQEILRYLQPKYPLYAASNAPTGQQEKRLRDAGLLGFFERIFVSGDIGFSKPSADFFSGCFSFLPSLSPEHTVMIGDSLSADIIGAKNYGLQTLWVNVHGEEANENADETVTKLLEIKNIL